MCFKLHLWFASNNYTDLQVHGRITIKTNLQTKQKHCTYLSVSVDRVSLIGLVFSFHSSYIQQSFSDSWGEASVCEVASVFSPGGVLIPPKKHKLLVNPIWPCSLKQSYVISVTYEYYKDKLLENRIYLSYFYSSHYTYPNVKSPQRTHASHFPAPATNLKLFFPMILSGASLVQLINDPEFTQRTFGSQQQLCCSLIRMIYS